ncbi:hypothetical protein GE061_020321 [Apolygus lucorum]|uniref:Uncharacterized protein n=1 Tax=Apolygus lucorum TaxID=248454 RepID=A0A6A4KLY9_APOLU|nr:hypothetical protein GE061_020321 [Apolygus lucorum]
MDSGFGTASSNQWQTLNRRKNLPLHLASSPIFRRISCSTSSVAQGERFIVSQWSQTWKHIRTFKSPALNTECLERKKCLIANWYLRRQRRYNFPPRTENFERV